MQALLWSRELTNEAKNQDSTAKEEPEKPEKATPPIRFTTTARERCWGLSTLQPFLMPV